MSDVLSDGLSGEVIYLADYHDYDLTKRRYCVLGLPNGEWRAYDLLKDCYVGPYCDSLERAEASAQRFEEAANHLATNQDTERTDQ